MNVYKATVTQMLGDDTEHAYDALFGGRTVGGFGDSGLDILTGDNTIPFVQIKSSAFGLKAFLAESLRRKKFIPVCVGEPGPKKEVLRHLTEYGAWIGTDIPGRDKLKSAVAQVRSLCTA